MKYQRDSARRNGAIFSGPLLSSRLTRQYGPMVDHSDAAIITLADPSSPTAEALRRVMVRRRYSEQETPVPDEIPLALDEQINFELGTTGGLMAIRTPVDAVFRVASWWSNEFPERPLAAVRRYMHSDPCVKYFADGRPIWRLGSDRDHEVDFDVPTRRPFDAFDPDEVGLPASPAAAARLMERMAVTLTSSWIRSTSQLAP